MHVAGTTLQGDRGQKSIRTQTYQINNIRAKSIHNNELYVQ